MKQQWWMLGEANGRGKGIMWLGIGQAKMGMNRNEREINERKDVENKMHGAVRMI